MLNVLDSTKELYTQSSQKNLVITFPNRNITLVNANIVYESVELKESIETEDQLNFKGCNSSSFKFSCAEINYDLRNEYVEATIQAGTSEIIPLFSGYVVSQTNRTNEDVVTEFECQDILYSIRNQDVTSWYNGLTFPITVKNFRNSFFTLLGIDQVVDIHDPNDTGDLINDSQTLTKIDSAKLPKVLNAGTIMEDICQINARYGQYGRDKKFHYRQLREIMKGLYPSYETFPSPTTYPSGENADSRYDLSAYSKISYEPYTVEKITGVTIRDNEGNATSKGMATNVFTIADNMLASSLSDKATACQNILNEVKVVWYIPLNLECVGYPWIECGDVLLTRTKKNIVRSYVLQRTLKGIQALFDTIESEGLQTREEYRESEATGVSTNRAGVKNNADEIVATKLRVGTIEADYVKATKINTYSIYARQITGGTAELGYINGGVIEVGSISADRIDANGINANQIKAGTLDVRRIGDNSISANKLDFYNADTQTMAIRNIQNTGSATISTLYVGYAGTNYHTGRWAKLEDISGSNYVFYSPN